MRHTLLNELLTMLTYARPAASVTEAAFIATYVSNLPGASLDAYGNWHVTVGSGERSILWSCHTDTVHRHEGRQTIHYNETTGVVGLSRASKHRGSSCLGADDTAGVFLLRQMILRGVPGHYVFHYAEERGGVGSHALAAGDPAWLAQFDIAIALDRRGTSDVITHQYGGRTCSEAFALSLACALNLPYEPEHGVFTDTANYADDIAECSNLSVGYAREHSPDETLATWHVLTLLEALTLVCKDQLVVSRKPGDNDYASYGRWGLGYQLPLAIDRTGSLDDTDLVECAACGMWSWFAAEDADGFCRLCADAIRADDCEPRSTYLDPAFADVQHALRLVKGENQ